MAEVIEFSVLELGLQRRVILLLPLLLLLLLLMPMLRVSLLPARAMCRLSPLPLTEQRRGIKVRLHG